MGIFVGFPGDDRILMLLSYSFKHHEQTIKVHQARNTRAIGTDSHHILLSTNRRTIVTKDTAQHNKHVNAQLKKLGSIEDRRYYFTLLDDSVGKMFHQNLFVQLETEPRQ